jgi:beta-N-acetylhexosaminidase
MKHMPGHGRATLDSHKDLPRVTAPPEALAADFAPFRALADLPMAMTAHIVFEALDPEAPATQSARMVRIIRDEIGFGGLLMTDDLSMKALGGGFGTRAERALAAGCDVILHCNGDRAEMDAVTAATPRLAGAALARAEAALALRGAPDGDPRAMVAEFEALTAGAAHA